MKNENEDRMRRLERQKMDRVKQKVTFIQKHLQEEFEVSVLFLIPISFINVCRCFPFGASDLKSIKILNIGHNGILNFASSYNLSPYVQRMVMLIQYFCLVCNFRSI